MELASEDQVRDIDPQFGVMAGAVGRHAWSVPHLTMREKAFVFLAADLCTANLGFPLATHVQMAGMNGVGVEECRAAIRHLAPFAGYPTAAMALRQLAAVGEEGGDRMPAAAPPARLPEDIHAQLSTLDADFAAFVTGQFSDRWNDPAVSPRERALSCLATDVLHQTLGDPFELHVRLAIEAGAGSGQLRSVLLLVAEYAIGKAWTAYAALGGLGV